MMVWRESLIILSGVLTIHCRDLWCSHRGGSVWSVCAGWGWEGRDSSSSAWAGSVDVAEVVWWWQWCWVSRWGGDVTCTPRLLRLLLFFQHSETECYSQGCNDTLIYVDTLIRHHTCCNIPHQASVKMSAGFYFIKRNNTGYCVAKADQKNPKNSFSVIVTPTSTHF